MTERQIKLMLEIYKGFKEKNKREFVFDARIEGIYKDLRTLQSHGVLSIRGMRSVIIVKFLIDGIEVAERYRSLYE